MPGRCASHEDRRIGRHLFGHVDPRRVASANIMIGPGHLAGLFGDPNAVAYVVPQIIKFPRPQREDR
jgi:hypothetical protein